MEIDPEDSPDSMDAEATPSSSAGAAVGPNRHALDAVAVAPPSRRRTSGQRSMSASPSRSRSSSPNPSSGDGWIQPEQEEIEEVMERYHELQQEFVEQQVGLAPHLVPANQALLEVRVAELMQQRRGKRLEAAEPGAAADAASSGHKPPDKSIPAAAAAAAASADGNSSEDQGKSEHRGPTTAAAAGGVGEEKSRQYYAKYSSNEGKGYVKKAFRLAYEQRIPEYVSWSYLVRNEIAAGHGQRMFYTDETGETVLASDDEEEDHKPWDGDDGRSHDYALTKLAEEYAGHLKHLLYALEQGLHEEQKIVTADELAARLQELHEREHPKQPPSEEQRRSAPFRESAAAFHAHFCRRCNIYNCRQHGGGHVKPGKLPAPPPVDHAPPCSNSCWKLIGTAAAAAAAAAAGTVSVPTADEADDGAVGNETVVATPAAAADGDGKQRRSKQQQQQQQQQQRLAVPDFSEYELGLLQQGLRTLGRDSCSLALLLLDRSCAEVGEYLAGLPEEKTEDLEDVEVEGGAAAAGARRRKKGAKRDVPVRRIVANNRAQRARKDGSFAPYTPCSCEGPCKKGSCSCIASDNYCEKFCGCVGCAGRDCFFAGCTCTTFCRSERCPCMAEGRECDPEVCRNCTATAQGTALPGECCSNMGMRLRKGARMYMGLSSVSGWGAFIAEAAKKGDFLGEYVGEMVNQQEADRRGKAYDRSNNSYLFGVNSEWVLDARDAGNKLRFANHKSHPNCHSRVLMVDGDHHCGLYAMQDIRAGEELFYNYRYDLDNAPDWAIRE